MLVSSPAKVVRPVEFSVIEEFQDQYIQTSFQIPYVEKLFDVIDARLYNGRRKMTESMRKGGVFLFIDVNNLKKINELYGRDIGDSYVENALVAIRSQVGAQAEIYRLGGDEFAVVIERRSPKSIQALIQSIEQEVANKAQAALKPGIQKAGQIQIQKLENAKTAKARNRLTIDFTNNIGRFSRASVSVGAAYIDPRNLRSTQDKAEDRARLRKIQIKVNAGLSVAKYKSPIDVDTTKKPSFILEEPPQLIPVETYPQLTPVQAKGSIPVTIGESGAKGFLILYDHPEFSIREHFDDQHRSSFWIYDLTNPDSKPQLLHASAVTELPSLITTEGQAFDKKFRDDNRFPRARIEFKLAGLLHFNYFKDGIESGDQALKFMGVALQRAIKQELKQHVRSTDIVFSSMGSDFVVYVQNVPEAVALEIQKRIVLSVANSPAIRDLIQKEITWLELNPETRDLAVKLRVALDPDHLIESNESQFQFFAGK